MPSLLVIKGPNQGQQFPLTREKTVLGRNPDCDVVINVGAVSREHAQILALNGNYYVKDLKSRNLTFVNDERVDPDKPPVLLKHEDRLRICDFICTFQNPPLPDVPEEEETATVMSSMSIGAASALESQPAERLRTLLELTNSLSKTLELQPLLPRILDALFQVFRQADRAFLILKDETSQQFVPNTIKTRRPTDEGTARFSRTILNKCLENQTAILSEDVSQDKALVLSASISDFRIRSLMCAPLQTPDGEIIGAIQVDTSDRQRKFNQDDLQLLMAVANQAAVAMQNARLHEDLLAKQKMLREMELAKHVQASFLPANLPAIPGYEFFAHYQAAREVGGDFYSFVELPGNKLAIGVGDVAGKGIPAALMMARLSGDFRYSLLMEPDPAAVVCRMNNQFQQAGALDRFVTFVLVILDLASHRITVVNAGHVPPIIRRAQTRQLDEIAYGDDNGLPLGVLEDYEYQAFESNLDPGDCVFLCSDGILDATSLAQENFGLDRLRAAIHANGPHAELLGKSVLKSVLVHATDPVQFDDMTLVTFGRNP